MDTVLDKNSKLTSKLNSIEHQIYRELRPLGLEGSHCLLAVSGGVDSIVMLQILKSLRPLLKIELSVACIHHGLAKGECGAYRDKSWQAVHDKCISYDIPFFSNINKLSDVFALEISSEAELREYRYKFLNQFKDNLPLSKSKKQTPLLCLAHNQSDLLETRMIQLVRGSGLAGLASMKQWDGEKLRPLLSLSRQKIEDYAKEKALQWEEDPSNKSSEPLRNWMRQLWLPMLEKKRPGSLETLSRSLTHLTEEIGAGSGLEWGEVFQNGTINRSYLLELSTEKKAQVLARFMRELGMKNYSRNHIDEVLKRLDNRQVEYKFTLLKHDWTVNAEQVTARPKKQV